MKLIFTRQTKQRQAQLQKAADKVGITRVPEWEITGFGKNTSNYWPVTTEEVRERIRICIEKHDRPNWPQFKEALSKRSTKC